MAILIKNCETLFEKYEEYTIECQYRQRILSGHCILSLGPTAYYHSKFSHRKKEVNIVHYE